jgi:16S rRNA (uracil1498-N3)-methyltransferase
VRVLRLTVGDGLVLFNGEGGEYAATLEAVVGSVATVRINAFDPREAEMPVAVCLAQGLPAAEKMDWALEKAIELGAHSVQPVTMHRSVARLSAERALKRHAHWLQIARAASEQCGRNRVATVLPLAEFHAWLISLPPRGLRLLLAADAVLPLARVPRPEAGVTVYILAGPEGGMTPDEKASALSAGFTAVSLGPRILRTETAGAAALVTLATAWSLAAPEPAHTGDPLTGG